MKLICQGKKVGHILFNTLWAWFTTYKYFDTCGPPLVFLLRLLLLSLLSTSPQMLEMGLASSTWRSVRKMRELVQLTGPGGHSPPRSTFSASSLLGDSSPLLGSHALTLLSPCLFHLQQKAKIWNYLISLFVLYLSFAHQSMSSVRSRTYGCILELGKHEVLIKNVLNE